MSKLAEPRLPLPPPDASEYDRRLHLELTSLLRRHVDQVNALSEGWIGAAYLARTAAPTAIVMKQGDFIANIKPTETGTTGSKYSLSGWRCILDGTASASSVVEVRTPTGA